MAKPWKPDDVLGMARGYQAACVLAAAAELDLFSVLAGERLSAGDLAASLGADPRATTVLLDALVALDLLDKDGAEYGVSPEVAAALTEKGEQNVLAMVRHQANCLRRWTQLAQVTRTGKPAGCRPSIRGEAADLASFIGAMDVVSRPMAAAVVAEVRPLEFRHLLDVGGGPGTWTIALLRAVPEATATLLDLPAVIPLARQRIAEAGLVGRVTFAACDYLADALPAGADFAWLSAIVHQNSPEQNRALFAKVNAALTEGGHLVIRDVVMDPSRTRPPAGALFAVNMLVATSGGGTYTFDELRDGLLASGFVDPVLLRRGEHVDSLVRATKPAR